MISYWFKLFIYFSIRVSIYSYVSCRPKPFIFLFIYRSSFFISSISTEPFIYFKYSFIQFSPAAYQEFIYLFISELTDRGSVIYLFIYDCRSQVSFIYSFFYFFISVLLTGYRDLFIYLIY